MAKKPERTEAITISAPRLMTAEFLLDGTAPYMMARFSQKAINEIRAKHVAGSQSRKGKAKEPRNFDQEYLDSMHLTAPDGEKGSWCGIPAGAFRAACIRACSLVGFKMTLAKLSIFVEPDGFDYLDGSPLVKINGSPEMVEFHVRNKTGVVDLRARPMWRKWSVNLRIKYDADQFSQRDVANLIARVGAQVGIGEGRPDSRTSAGLGYGLFEISEQSMKKAA